MGRKSILIRCYALFLAGEKRKEEEMIEVEDSLGQSGVVNRELAYLERDLSTLCKNGSIDPFGLYLYGLVLKEKGNKSMARTIIVEFVNNYPWNWKAWSELQSLCSSTDILCSFSLKNHWMKEFLLAIVFQDLRMHPVALSRYERLQGVFRDSNYILSHIAKVHCSLIEFEIVFEELWRNDPYRVEDMNLNSNVLYVKGCSSVLSYLAHKIFTIDKYMPKYCCIKVNYYSLKGEHEKSILYFKDLERMDANEREGSNMIEALMFVATHCRDQNKFEETEVYCGQYLEVIIKDMLRACTVHPSNSPYYSPVVLDGYPPPTQVPYIPGDSDPPAIDQHIRDWNCKLVVLKENL